MNRYFLSVGQSTELLQMLVPHLQIAIVLILFSAITEHFEAFYQLVKLDVYIVVVDGDYQQNAQSYDVRLWL